MQDFKLNFLACKQKQDTTLEYHHSLAWRQLLVVAQSIGVDFDINVEDGLFRLTYTPIETAPAKNPWWAPHGYHAILLETISRNFNDTDLAVLVTHQGSKHQYRVGAALLKQMRFISAEIVPNYPSPRIHELPDSPMSQTVELMFSFQDYEIVPQLMNDIAVELDVAGLGLKLSNQRYHRTIHGNYLFIDTMWNGRRINKDMHEKYPDVQRIGQAYTQYKKDHYDDASEQTKFVAALQFAE